MNEKKYEYMHIYLGPVLCFKLTDDMPGKVCLAGDTEYFELDAGDWEGFYDWLRTERDNIIGCRFWAWDHVASIFAAAATLSYCAVDNGSLCIYFSEERSFIPEISDDQDFLFSKVYKSNTGDYALAVSIRDLQVDEFSKLRYLIRGREVYD
jgi:hypothetical protein